VPVTDQGRARQRRSAERILTDVVVVESLSGPVTAPGSIEAAVTATRVYYGPGLVAATRSSDNETSVTGSRNRASDDYSLLVPLRVVDAVAGCRVTVVRSADPALTGAVFDAASSTAHSYSTLRRLSLVRHTDARRVS